MKRWELLGHHDRIVYFDVPYVDEELSSAPTTAVQPSREKSRTAIPYANAPLMIDPIPSSRVESPFEGLSDGIATVDPQIGPGNIQ